LFFDDQGRAEARATWRLFDGREDVSREFHELENGRWIQKA
jgi:DNA polymerase III subunit chi